MESVSLGIRGMTCASCTARVERALTKVAGVSAATVNLATEPAHVRFHAQQTGVPALLEAVARAGYDPVTERTSLAVSGMTCASCTARVERSLKRLDGVVDASVNLATERASVTYLPGLLTPADLSAAVTAAGYEAREAAASGERVDRERQAREAEVRALRRDVVLAGALTLPLVVFVMLPMLVPALEARLLALVPAQAINLAGQLSIKELGALSAAAELFVGVDSMPMHLAAAMGTPTAALFGPSGETEWGPWNTPSRVVSTTHTCRPCGQDGCGGGGVSECLTLLPVDAVFNAATELLEK